MAARTHKTKMKNNDNVTRRIMRSREVLVAFGTCDNRKMFMAVGSSNHCGNKFFFIRSEFRGRKGDWIWVRPKCKKCGEPGHPLQITFGPKVGRAVLHAIAAMLRVDDVRELLETKHGVPPIRPGESCLDIVNGRIPGGTRG